MTVLLGLLLACGGAPEAPPPPAPAPVEPEPMVQAPPSPDAVEQALARALAWLEAYPGQPYYDAIIGADGLAALGRKGWAAHRDRVFAGHPDTDHEHRRFVDPDYHLPKEHVHRWTAPETGRVNTNRVITDALYCAEHGWRPQTEAYACGPMRDEGGYHTAHALWALVIARDHGCVQEACIPALSDELEQAQPEVLAPLKTADIDLFAERLLMRCLADRCGPAEAGEAQMLLDAQDADGSWGLPTEGEDPYFRYHATMAAAWALAAWDSAR